MSFDPNTHGAFIQFKDGSTAFVDGIPDACDHDDNGPALSFNDRGEYFKDSEMPDYHTDYDAWLKFQQDHDIRGGCVSCSKCGKPYSPPLY